MNSAYEKGYNSGYKDRMNNPYDDYPVCIMPDPEYVNGYKQGWEDANEELYEEE